MLYYAFLVLLDMTAAFILLYPFYLRDRRPSDYRGVWKAIGSFTGDRHGSVWLLIVLCGGTFFMITSNHTFSLLLYSAVVAAYLIFSGLLLLYPYYLKYRFPERYVGIWRNVGEWMGEPMISLSRKKY